MNKFVSSFLIILLPILTSGLFVGQLILSNELTQKGAQLTIYEEGIDSLNKKNDVLEQQIASFSSLMTIEEKAKVFGFSEGKTVMVITENQPVALLSLR